MSSIKAQRRNEQKRLLDIEFSFEKRVEWGFLNSHDNLPLCVCVCVDAECVEEVPQKFYSVNINREGKRVGVARAAAPSYGWQT